MKLWALIAVVLLAGCGGGRNADRVQTVRQGKSMPLNDSILAAGVADTLDFGRLRSGENLVREVTLLNDGDKPLVILGVETSCGCLEIDYPKKPLAPGESAQLSVALYSAGITGYQFKPVALRTSLGPERYRIIVTAEIL